MAIAASMSVAAALVLAAANAGHAQENSKSGKGDEGRKNGQAINTQADYMPGERFTSLLASTPCPGTAESSNPLPGLVEDPFVLPLDYAQQVVAREGEGGTVDLWDMNTQNEFGKDAGRYVYRSQEIGTGSQVSVTDLKTDTTEMLAQRADWERFDRIVWTLMAPSPLLRRSQTTPLITPTSLRQRRASCTSYSSIRTTRAS
jgi:hypothetical protein